MPIALTPEQVEQFRTLGYVSGIPVFSAAEVEELRRGFDHLCELLDPDETPYTIDGWERYNTWLYELVHHPRLLDCVEDLLGPNFYQWGSNMLCKMPHEGIYIPWHEDLHDWPLSPGNTLTAWIAFDDVDSENGCLRVIPGSHRRGATEHVTSRPPPREDGVALLPFHADPDAVDEEEAVDIELRAGEVSFHIASLMHGSEGNNSDRRRCGFTACYASTDVRCDTSVRNENGDWSDFSIFMCRGVDEYRYHPHAPPPTGFGRAPRKEYRILPADLTASG